MVLIAVCESFATESEVPFDSVRVLGDGYGLDGRSVRDNPYVP